MRSSRSETHCSPRHSQASAATILLGLLSGRGFHRSAGKLRSSGVGRLVLVSLFLETRFLGKSRMGSLTLRSIRERLDTNVVFLVGTPDLDGEGFCNLFGNFEFGGRFQNADGADVMLVDAATAANHRQQPARFRLLLPSDGGAKPHTAFRHAMTRR